MTARATGNFLYLFINKWYQHCAAEDRQTKLSLYELPVLYSTVCKYVKLLGLGR